MDDLVYVQIACTDLVAFRQIQRHLSNLLQPPRTLPAREFIGVGLAAFVGRPF